MQRILMKSKIHNASVTHAELNYAGSITFHLDLIEKANIVENERVQVVSLNNGERFETYVIEGERGSGVICLNGPAARLAVAVVASCLRLTRSADPCRHSGSGA